MAVLRIFFIEVFPFISHSSVFSLYSAGYTILVTVLKKSSITYVRQLNLSRVF